MCDEKPVVYILRGDDREAVEGYIQTFYEKLGSPDMADMNISHLEENKFSLNELRSAALALPFLTERRLVIVEDALKPFAGRGKQEFRQEFLSLLDSLPPSTGLVLIAQDFMKYNSQVKRWDWSSVHDQHWLIKWAQSAGTRATIIDCPLPRGREMESWIKNKVAELGGAINPRAATKLSEFVGSNTLRAFQEINKLLTYVNYARPIDHDDVEALTTEDRESDIFDLVDAIGRRDGVKALEMLHLLLEVSDVIPIFSMITRQFRLLLETKEITAGGGNERDVTQNLHVHPFVAHKLIEQGEKFDLEALEMIYHRLLVIDVDHKTGGMPEDIALDVLIAQLTQDLVY